jgi:hypothetical protein
MLHGITSRRINLQETRPILQPLGSCPVLTDFANCTLIIGSTFTKQIEPCITTCRNPTKATLMSHAKVQRVWSFLEQTRSFAYPVGMRRVMACHGPCLTLFSSSQWPITAARWAPKAPIQSYHNEKGLYLSEVCSIKPRLPTHCWPGTLVCREQELVDS